MSGDGQQTYQLTTNWSGYTIAGWAGVGLLGFGIIAAALQGNISGALTLAGFLVALGAFLLWRRRLPRLFDLLFAVAILLNAGGWAWDFYKTPGPYDEIAHAFTTFAITLALGFLVQGAFPLFFSRHPVLFVLMIASFGIAIGGVWEIAEWSADQALGTKSSPSLNDSMLDMVMDSAGAIIAAVCSLWALQARRKPAIP